MRNGKDGTHIQRPATGGGKAARRSVGHEADARRDEGRGQAAQGRRAPAHERGGGFGVHENPPRHILHEAGQRHDTRHETRKALRAVQGRA